MTKQEFHLTPFRKLTAEKTKILSRLHDFFTEQEIAYFAVDGLARAAQLGEKMVEENWTVAMIRSEYRRFLKLAAPSGCAFGKDHRGVVTFSHSESKHCIFIDVYDALPVGLKEQNAFLKELDELRKKGDSKRLATKYENDPSALMIARVMSGEGAPMHRAVLYPIKNRTLEDIKVCVPCDCGAWLVAEDQYIALQKREVLKQLDAFCQQQEIPYFAISKLEASSRMYGDIRPDYGRAAMEIGVLRYYFDDFAALTKNDPRFTVYATERSGKNTGAVYITLSEFAEEGTRPDATITAMPYDYLPQEEHLRKRFLADTKKLNEEYNSAYSGDKNRKKKLAPELFKQLTTRCVEYNDRQTSGRRYIARVQGAQGKVLPCHHVFPLVRSKLGDFEINCPCNPYLWAENTNIDFNNAANELKASLLKRLLKLCQEHQIECFSIANLLIGMVTYGDYVPDKPNTNWDVALLRADYEKLLGILREKAEQYELRLSESFDSEGRLQILTKRICARELSWPDGELRLIPFDKIPEAYDTQYAFLRKLRKLNELYKAMLDRELTGSTSYNAKKLEKAYQKYGPDAPQALYAQIDRLAQSYNDDAQTHLYGRVAFERSKFIHEDQLFPLAKGFVRDVQMNRPNDYSVWTPVIDEALHVQVTSIQQADLILIDKIDEICRKLDIGYFICGGSMLGYARNGGFIPWDDDIDVAMLRADYDRFMAEAGAYLDDRFFLQTRQTDPEIPYLFSKLRLNNTEYITKYNERRAFHKGICLDIFPFDFIPNSPKEQEKFKKEVLALSAAHNRVVNNQMPEPIDPIKPRNSKERYYKLYGKAKRFYFRCQSLKKTQQAYLDKATSLNSRAEELGLTTVASFVPSYTYIKLEDLLPYQDVLFEGHRVKVPRRPEVFLTMQYGDYLQLPPKHNRVAHKLLRWSVDVKADKENANEK